MMPVIRKADRIVGHHLTLRNADVSDAAFIVELRTDAKKGRYISPTSPEVAAQEAWLRRYAEDASQAYFVVEDESGTRAGTIRMYDAAGDSFCFGSWIMRAGSPVACAIESILILYQYALLELGFSRSYFAVRKQNRSVWQFMEGFGAHRSGETDTDYLFETERAPVLASFRRYARYLPAPLRIVSAG